MNIKKVILVLTLFSVVFTEAQNGLGYKFEVGPGTEALFTRGRNNVLTNSAGFQALEDSLYLTLGVTGEAKITPIYHEYFSYGYYGKIARGWLINNTSNYYYHGHDIELKYAGNKLLFRTRSGYEEFFRYSIRTSSATSVTENIGWTEFLKIKKTYLGYQRDFNDNLSIAAEVVFKSIESDSTATGFNVTVQFQQKNRINLELYPSHPVWGYNWSSTISSNDLIKRSVFFNLTYARWFSFEKYYKELF